MRSAVWNVCLRSMPYDSHASGPPFSQGPEGRKNLAHGASRGIQFALEGPEPRQGRKTGQR